MKIIIVGAGFTGTQLARRLIQEKNDVVLIERDEDTARHVSNRLDCLVIPGNGNNLAALKEAGIAKAGGTNAVLAGMARRPGDVTSSDVPGVSGTSSDQTTR